MYFCSCLVFFFFKQKTAYEMRISDWSSDVCSSDLVVISDVADTSLRKAAASRGGSCLSWEKAGKATRERARASSRLAASSARLPTEIGRASCRERVCQYV